MSIVSATASFPLRSLLYIPPHKLSLALDAVQVAARPVAESLVGKADLLIRDDAAPGRVASSRRPPPSPTACWAWSAAKQRIDPRLSIHTIRRSHMDELEELGAEVVNIEWPGEAIYSAAWARAPLASRCGGVSRRATSSASP